MPAESRFDRTAAYPRRSNTWQPSRPIYATPVVASDLDFKLLGTNAVDGDCAMTIAGMSLASHGGASDSAILAGVATSVYGISTAWYAQKQPAIAVKFITDTALTNTTIWSKLGLTNTATVATDDDQFIFKYVNGTDTNWQFTISRAGTDVTVDTGVAVAASTEYKLEVITYPDLTLMAFINDVPIRSTQFAAMTASTALLPFTGVLSATSATAKKIFIQEIVSSVAL